MPNTLLTIVITFLGIFILFIFNKRKKTASDYTLICLNLICAAMLYVSVGIASGLTIFSFYIHNTLPFWLFPVFILYAMQLITYKRWQRYYWLFFIFTIPMTIFVTYDVFFAHQNFNVILENRFLHPPFIYHFFYKGSMIYAIFLSVGLLKKLKVYTSAIQNNFSYIEKIRLKWLGHFAIAMTCIYSFSLIAFLAYNFGWIKNIDNVYIALNGLIVLSFLYLSFHGVKHYSIEAIPSIDESLTATSKKLSTKATVNNTASRNEKSQKIYQELLRLFEHSQLFTKPQLKLSDVAKELKIPPHQLSQIINANYGKPFYDFVANYRVDLLKEKLKSTEHRQYTILSLGLEAGFNSKASLNRVFKEYTGLTPSQFQKSHLPK